MNGTYLATVDRIMEDGSAILLLEEDGNTVDDLLVEINKLPKDGQHINALFEVQITDGRLAEVEYLPKEEKERINRIEEKFNRLAKRPDELDPTDLQ